MLSTNTHSRSASVFYGVLGSQISLPVSLFHFISRSNAQGKVLGPWGACHQLKMPFKGPRLRQQNCWEEQNRTLFFPMVGHFLHFFTKSKPKNIELVARPLAHQKGTLRSPKKLSHWRENLHFQAKLHRGASWPTERGLEEVPWGEPKHVHA